MTENQQCLQRALNCEHLAATALSSSNRELLLHLAKRWRTLAEDHPMAKPPVRQRSLSSDAGVASR
jgi:hypothetical protein